MKDSRSPDASTSPVGARHDDSSLFTLDALKKTEEEARQQKKSDDSGLIDLKALAAIAQERPKQPDMAVAAVVAPPDLFSIAAPLAPMVAPSVTTAAPEIAQPRPNRTGLYVAVGGAVAAVLAVGIFFATRGSGESAAATATATVAAALPPVVTAAPAPTPDEPRVAAVNPGERPPPKEEPPKPAPTAAAIAPKPVVAARGPLPKAAPKEDAPAPKPPVDACDLACQMQRAVQKKK